MNLYEHVIWLPGWSGWLLLALWIVGACVLGGFFMRNMPDYGPADAFVASFGPMVLAIILSGGILVGSFYLLSFVGLEFGFRS